MKLTQRQRILEALINAGDAGINSYTARQELHIIQLPVRVRELKGEGHTILSVPVSDKSVQYILVQNDKSKYEREGRDWVWDINDSEMLTRNMFKMFQKIGWWLGNRCTVDGGEIIEYSDKIAACSVCGKIV